MAQITLKNISKQYDKVKALSEVTLEIAEKEFLVLFGPAGAGKTTLLSIIAGILPVDEGNVYFNNECIDDYPPNNRNVAMVFENYALYPHFTVYDNIAFPLRSPKFKKEEGEIKNAIDTITRKMNIHHLLHRYPSQLSNGQRQRVAIGRALVRNPNVFLMDEPLAHLDAKLRNTMRTELKDMQQQLDSTTIYVTHDYLEALSLGDRIAVIKEGTIIQVDTPETIYYEPSNTFVAKLIGEPEINLYHCTINAGTLFFTEDKQCKVPIDAEIQDTLRTYGIQDTILVGVRGVDIAVSLEHTPSYLEGTIFDFHSIGNRFVVNIAYQGLMINTLVAGDCTLEIDKQIFFKIDYRTLIFFHPESEEFICRAGKTQWHS